jgi:tRNA threonylcarbamoyladenosine biosynthesis protein TsaB
MLLALETSDRLCAACLYDVAKREVFASETLNIGKGHAELLMGVIDTVLARAEVKFSQLTSVATCIGPGSFTGIRVGVSAAIGFSIALNIPKIGITSLQALATQAAQGAGSKDILVLLDAHRGDVYAQRFSPKGETLTVAAQISVADLVEQTDFSAVSLCGSGVSALLALHPAIILNALSEFSYPSVEAVALAASNPAFQLPVKPLYLRRPDAKPQASYTIARAAR